MASSYFSLFASPVVIVAKARPVLVDASVKGAVVLAAAGLGVGAGRAIGARDYPGAPAIAMRQPARRRASSTMTWCSRGSAQRARPSGGSWSMGSKYV
jgi:hypothetical protein